MSSRPKAAPHVHISEPHLRVTEWRFTPGAEQGGTATGRFCRRAPGWRRLYLGPGGGSRTATLKRMSLMRGARALSTNVINANPYDFAFIEIEHLKP